jgi:hypothetical protein
VPQNLHDGQVIDTESAKIRRQPTTESVIAEPLDFLFLQDRENDTTKGVRRRRRRHVIG